MQLPKQLEELRERKIWLCYPMIYNPVKHNGVGGYDKPPINPYTLKNGSSDNPEHLSTFDEANARIGSTAYIASKTYTGNAEVKGVGISLTVSGLIGIDFDNVLDKELRRMTQESYDIMHDIKSYSEVSPSGDGLHILALGKLPDNSKKIFKDKFDKFKTYKAEYQFMDSGYITISGNVATSKYGLAERTAEIADVYERYLKVVPPVEKLSTERPASSVVSCDSTGYTYDRWLYEVSILSDAEVLERIFKSGSLGRAVKALYNGDTSAYGNDHSRADQALCTYLYGFTNDRALTETLFRSSSLYRDSGKSRNYLERTLNKASTDCTQFVGHIVFTDAEKKAYAQKKEAEEWADFDAKHKRGF